VPELEQLLPRHLGERVAPGTAVSRVAPNGEFILYWVRTALRAHDNPALDTALVLGTRLGLPVFIYHALSERYPYASDRHHMFILEGARDLAAQLAARHIGTAFHLERRGHRGSHLRTLASRAAIVVTERMPVAPLAGWTAALRDAVQAPVWEVDTACVVPVTLTASAFDRAFMYRDATAAIRRARIGADWPDIAVTGDAFVPAVPFEPVDFATADFATLIAECDIDHAVGPVADTRGGSTAGYARWREFTESGRLDRYDRGRNDPARGDGVSRMSAYLHYGMVSPFRLARDAARHSSEGAAKWLDELLVWRELAYTFCHHRPDHASIAALPAWARATLAAHEGDARTLYDWESLARGATADAFWNEMQRSLLAHGEIHNNVRMTWGKAFAGWTPDAARALAASIDLNHRYALDGRDPSSYAGILWVLGRHDRPWAPERPVYGTVRYMSSENQARKHRVKAYLARWGG
jgi:photolyase PhrII